MKNVSITDLNFIKDNYGTLSQKEIGKTLGFSRGKMLYIYKTLKIQTRNYKKFTKEQEEILKKIYPISSPEEIMKLFPNKKWIHITNKATKMGLKRIDKGFNIRKGNPSKLLNNTPETLYWIGFLLADGHFSKENRLVLSLAVKDKEHLLKFAKYLECGTIFNYKDGSKSSVSVMDKIIIPIIKEKFNISNIKTYEPPNFNLYNLTNDEWVALICGFIDGDGHMAIGKHDWISIIIKCHSSWIVFFEKVKQKFIDIFNIESGHPKINSYGYAVVGFGNKKLIQNLKNKALSLNLPLMSRKWNKII